MTPLFDDRVLWRFRDIISRRLGMACSGTSSDQLTHVLEERLRVAGNQTVDHYLDRLEAASAPLSEIRRVAERLTVTETYFFRHLDQIRAFADVALPERIQRSGFDRTVSILSVGCSSGEEPYTLAMECDTRLSVAPGWHATVTGIDVNDRQIARARRGVYSEWALRTTPNEIQTRYFRRDGKDFLLDDRIKSAVSFECRNLMESNADFWKAGCFDVIFCRNVLMYFTAPAMHEVVAHLTSSLKPGGYLFLGSAETLRGISQDFHLCHTHDTFYYRRRSTDEDRTHSVLGVSVPEETIPLWGASPPRPTALHPMPDDTLWPEEIARSTQRVAQLLDASTQLAPPHSTAPSALPEPLPLSATLQAIRALMHKERYQDAIQALSALPESSAKDPDAQLLLAVVLTHRSDIPEAEQVCRHLLSLDDLNAGAHYLMALCAEHRGQRPQAWEHDQTAAYLDPSFALPHLHMGRLAKIDGNLELARRAFQQAHALLEREDASRILLFGGGFNRAALLRLCQAEVSAAGKRHDR